MIQKAVLRSPDWAALSNSERVVWVHLKADFNGKNPEHLVVTYNSMKKIMAPATLSKAFKGLEEKGWIEKTQHGGLFRNPTAYRLKGPWSKLPC